MSVHLNVRSYYSLLNGMMSLNEILESAKSNHMKSVAITDYHVLFGSLDFFIRAQAMGIKPIFGMEITIEEDEERYDALVLARNNVGYQRLMAISFELSKHSCISLEDLANDSDNLYVIMFSENGCFEEALIHEDYGLIQTKISKYKSLFKHLRIGMSHQESAFFKERNHKLYETALLNEVKCVAMTKVFYKQKADDEAFRALRAIEKGTYIGDKTLVSAPNRYFYSERELRELYSESLLKETELIANDCNVDILSIKTELPRFETGQNVENAYYLEKLSQFGLQKRLGDKINQQYKERLAYELSVITSMSFEDYFLIVYDIIRFAKQEGIYVGPGRGSAAGSLVAYSLGITEVDPIEYNLLFERFLNPKRISMPDIDIDFPDDRRQDVIDYVREKYGDNHIAHIVTFGTLKARQAFRDVARVLQVPIRKVDQATKLMNQASLRDNYEQQGRLKTMIDTDPLLQDVFNLAIKVEGLPRHTSLHAAGIVMSKQPLLSVVPMMQMDDTTYCIQYDMVHIEKIGLIKIDFLGLRNLTIIDNISRQIKTTETFDIMTIPLDDKKTYDLIGRGETVGIFQLESEGMKKLLMKMKPYQFSDIVDTIALYRPGPMENIPLYLSARENPKSVKYLHPKLKEITELTYGVLIYQEQIMQVAQIMAGFDLGEADILRKAMGKKNVEELESVHQQFVSGCIEQGYDKNFSEELFALVLKFANYGFNKSHSVAYGLIAYQMAYLKANHPYMFYTYLLSSVIGSDSKTKQYIDECRNRNVLLMGPNLEKSYDTYKLEGRKIRLPFTVVKGISYNTSKVIEQERSLKGSYQSFFDAIARLNLAGIKKNNFENLIKAGAFDYFGYDRLNMLATLDEALRYANIVKVSTVEGDKLDYSLISEPLVTEVKESPREILTQESDVLGFYFSEHPSLSLRMKHKTTPIMSLRIQEEAYRFIGMVERIKQHRTKKGELMAFVNISDDTGNVDCVLFPRVYNSIKETLEVGALILIKGTMKEEKSIIVNDIYQFEKR